MKFSTEGFIVLATGAYFINPFKPKYFHAIGFYKETDTLKSSSILIYSEL
jgi:hypothetical protein